MNRNIEIELIAAAVVFMDLFSAELANQIVGQRD